MTLDDFAALFSTAVKRGVGVGIAVAATAGACVIATRSGNSSTKSVDGSGSGGAEGMFVGFVDAEVKAIAGCGTIARS